jgi:hypothetical protein
MLFNFLVTGFGERIQFMNGSSYGENRKEDITKVQRSTADPMIRGQV